MRSTLKTLLALAIAIVVMLLIRATVVTIYGVEGQALMPYFMAGDRVMVNRWSYGLRVGGNHFMHYSRLWRQPVERGDVVAVNDPTDTLQSAVDDRHVLFLRCKNMPGDSIKTGGKWLVIPSRAACDDADYYLMEPIGRSPLSGEYGRTPLLIPEDHIIGRAFLIIYSHDPEQPLWSGWRKDRFLAICGFQEN